MILTCKSCGADLNYKDGDLIAECEYCHVKNIIPQINNDKIVSLLNRGSHFCQKGDFDKATIAYENILSEDIKNSEAYWGLCMCKYGIEYNAVKLFAQNIKYQFYPYGN